MSSVPERAMSAVRSLPSLLLLDLYVACLFSKFVPSVSVSLFCFFFSDVHFFCFCVHVPSILQGKCFGTGADLGTVAGCDALARFIAEDLGWTKLHVLVNNSGYVCDI